MVHLARKHDARSVVRADDIAENEAIPPSFLAQILHELKRSGLVTSRRGKTGGWRLTSSPTDITLLTVVEALEPEILSAQGESAGVSGSAVTKVWVEIQEGTREVLSRQTLEAMAAGAEPMFYI